MPWDISRIFSRKTCGLEFGLARAFSNGPNNLTTPSYEFKLGWCGIWTNSKPFANNRSDRRFEVVSMFWENHGVYLNPFGYQEILFLLVNCALSKLQVYNFEETWMWGNKVGGKKAVEWCAVELYPWGHCVRFPSLILRGSVFEFVPCENGSYTVDDSSL